MSDPKQKRNSFFFFSSKNNGPKVEPKVETKVSNVKYVGKYPLMSSTKKRSESATSEIRTSSAPPSNTPETRQPQISAVINPASSGTTHRVGTLNRMRPPPPELQFTGIQSDSVPKSNVETDTRINEQDVLKSSDRGHQRKKSDIDELMDHLDQFGNESQLTYGEESSIGPFSSSDHYDTPSLNIASGSIDQEGYLRDNSRDDSDYGKSSSELASKRTDDRLRKSLSSVDNEDKIEDDDRFSFANSQVESVMELQQLSFNNEPKMASGNYRNSQEKIGHEQTSKTEQHSIEGPFTDSEASSSNYFYGDDQSFTDRPRQFRVVNEHRPNFTLNDGSSTTTDNESFTSTPALPSSAKHHTKVDQPPLITTLPTITPSPPSMSEGLDHEMSSSGSLPLLDKDLSPRSVPESEFTIQDQFSQPQETARLPSPRRNGTDKSVKLVSGYVEELRLKYFPTSNSLQPPPNLPFVLKTKNSLEQPQNIKVKIRTSSKQIGIKHGKAKQKLLSLETAKEEEEETDSAMKVRDKNSSVSTEVDHTREFHDLLNKSTSGTNLLFGGRQTQNGDIENSYSMEGDDLYLQNIPGDEAYDSDDVMAPLRDRGDHKAPLRFAGAHEGDQRRMGGTNGRINRSDTVTSYFTRQNINRIRSGTLDTDYINTVHKGFDPTLRDQIAAENSSDDELSVQTSNPAYLQSTFNGGLHVTNQDPESDED
ncbi:LAFA_0F18426g1_1 [Lachancea sp. 'fantastica']|nr:LAFA_0F18426g1_1 [Lachancea sp. 'fantastica']